MKNFRTTDLPNNELSVTCPTYFQKHDVQLMTFFLFLLNISLNTPHMHDDL